MSCTMLDVYEVCTREVGVTEGWAGFDLLCRAGPRPPTTVLTRHPSPPLSCHWRLRVLLNKSTPAQRPVAQAGRAERGRRSTDEPGSV